MNERDAKYILGRCHWFDPEQYFSALRSSLEIINRSEKRKDSQCESRSGKKTSRRK